MCRNLYYENTFLYAVMSEPVYKRFEPEMKPVRLLSSAHLMDHSVRGYTHKLKCFCVISSGWVDAEAEWCSVG